MKTDDVAIVDRAAAEIQRLWDECIADLGSVLTLTQLRVLLTIDRNGALRLGELAGELRSAPAPVTKVVVRLEQAGFVTRTADGPAVEVALSRAGAALARWARARYRASLAAVLDRMDGDGRAALSGSLQEFSRKAAAVQS